MSGIIAFGTYVPYNRIKRSTISEALEGYPLGKGTRAVASYDEDTTSLGVEAGRALMSSVPEGTRIDRLVFSTVDPAYADKTNATTIHAALMLDQTTTAVDHNGAVRSAVLSLVDAIESSSRQRVLTVLSDIRTGMAGGVDEKDGGDGAVAILTGEGSSELPVLAELVTVASRSEEFLDRWRTPGTSASKVWEERFGEFAYEPLVKAALADAFKQAGIEAGDITHFIVTGTQARTVAKVASVAGVAKEVVTDTLNAAIGQPGAAHLGLVLCDVLERAEPDQIIMAVSIADGVDVLVLKTTAAVADRGNESSTVARQIADGGGDLRYTKFLSWRDQLHREPPRRPDPERPAAPPTLRSEGWKYALEGSRCTDCGTRHLPPSQVCMECKAINHMEPERFSDRTAVISTFTIDRLAISPSPPLVGVVVDFEGGGRYRFEMTDVEADDVAIGNEVEMTFRRIFTADGIHNYFWKARPKR